jgi:tRNA-dihydrouridine synthase
MASFWNQLKKPFSSLAPMDDVTDTVFRQIVAKCARPDVFFTEFVNVEGLCSVGREKLLPRLKYVPSEHPIVAQIWGKKPENFRQIASELSDMGFDGVDINMGCPVKDVVRHGSGSALIDNPLLAGEIISAVLEGVQGSKRPIAVSVKTRIGFRTVKTEEWIGFLLGFGLDALTVHGRTAAEMSKMPAHWDEIGKAVRLRDQMKAKTLIIGNGDVRDYGDGCEKAKTYGVDGFMIGRGIFNDMFAFDPEHRQPDQAFMMQLMRTHMDLFTQTWGRTKSFIILRKFFKIYVSGFDNASEVRTKLMEVNTAAEALNVIDRVKLS